MRKEKVVIIESDDPENRDRGKAFFLTEMPAGPAERWADRAFLALAHSGVSLPPGIERQGMEGIYRIAKLVGHIDFKELSPLMDELMKCVMFIPDMKNPHIKLRLTEDGLEGDTIEEVSTRQFLRSEVMSLHINFSLAAVILNLIAAASDQTSLLEISENTSTSPRRSVRRSRVA